MKRGLLLWLGVVLASAPYAAAAPVLKPACFGDAQWHALQKDSARRKMPGFLLYVWSPRMVLSLLHAHEVQAVARSMDMHFIPVHDGRVPETEIREALAALPPDLAAQQLQSPVAYRMQASRPLCAPSLIGQDAYRHFPTAWVVWAGRVHPLPLVSAMPPAYWRMGMEQRLQSLRNQTPIEQ